MNWTELIIKSTFLEMREQTPYVWRLRSSGTQGEPEGLFWLVASATFYGGVCWGSSVGLLTGGEITDWVRRPALSWDGPLDPVEVVGERRAMAKLWSVMDNTSHPLSDTSSSDRQPHLQCVRERPRWSFTTNLH